MEWFDANIFHAWPPSFALAFQLLSQKILTQDHIACLFRRSPSFQFKNLVVRLIFFCPGTHTSLLSQFTSSIPSFACNFHPQCMQILTLSCPFPLGLLGPLYI